MSTIEPPEGWGKDEITKFSDQSRENEFATFVRLKADYAKLSAVDGGFRKLISYLDHSPEWFSAFFVLRAHSSFLAAIRLGMSCQISETHLAIRAILENGLYGLRISRAPELREVWLRRHNDHESLMKVKNEFKISTLLNILETEDKANHKLVKILYDRSIDFGGHPNERALSLSLKMEKFEKGINFKLMYLDDNPVAIGMALKTTAQAGVSVLDIFRCIYKERFDITGLTDDLVVMKKGL